MMAVFCRAVCNHGFLPYFVEEVGDIGQDYQDGLGARRIFQTGFIDPVGDLYECTGELQRKYLEMYSLGYIPGDGEMAYDAYWADVKSSPSEFEDEKTRWAALPNKAQEMWEGIAKAGPGAVNRHTPLSELKKWADPESFPSTE